MREQSAFFQEEERKTIFHDGIRANKIYAMKELEATLFKDYKADESSLLSYGFRKLENRFSLQKSLPSSKFDLHIEIKGLKEVDAKVFDEDFEYIAFRANVLGEFSAQAKKEIVEILLDIREHCFEYTVPPDVYLLPSNPKIYDIEEGFRLNEGFLNWPARKKTSPGDRIFIYSASPFKGIAFSSTVIAVDDMKTEEYRSSYYLTLIRLDMVFHKEELPLEELYAHGLKTVRFLHKLKQDIADYLLEIETKHS